MVTYYYIYGGGNNMYKRKNRRKKLNRGITLISLVVTIVVLLILAGVSISGLTGENSTINQAKKAKLATELSSYKEQVELFKIEQISKNNGFLDESLTAGKSIYFIIHKLKKTKEKEQ